MRDKHYFYTLLFITVVAICFTNPFMRFPYDIWEHLFTMDSEYTNLVHMPEGRKIWHYIWSDFFHRVGVDNSQLFLRARIIHVVQILLSFFSIFFFSKVLIRILFRSVDTLMLHYMAYWSVVIWFTIFATFSVHYHLAWILWYSVNYQIALPLFWYSIALTLIILFEEKSLSLQLFYLLQIVAVLLFILLVHPMEFLYFMMYLSILLLLYMGKVFSLVRHYYMVLIPFLIAIFYIIKQTYSDHLPYIVTNFQINNLPKLYDQIRESGEILVAGSNRAFASFNEMMVFVLLAGVGMFITLLYHYKMSHKAKIDIRMFLFLFIGSLFVLIPIFTLSAGVASILTKESAVNRFYYSSALFVLLPVVIYYIFLLLHQEKRVYLYNATIIIVLASVTLYSRDMSETKNYYKNIKSLEYSFDQNMVGFHLSPKDIETIGQRLQEYEAHRDHSREVLYLARGDIAMVLQYIYRKDVYWRGRKTNPTPQNIIDYKKSKESDPKFNRKELIIFETPKDFPSYEPFK